MARQTSLITFTGKLGNMIGYRRNGKYFLRSAPETVRQTHATCRAARRFGIASRKGALIRSAFMEELDVHCDSSHINRLNKTLIQAGRNNTEAITGFRFNQHTGIDKFFQIAPKLSRDGILHIPAQILPQVKGVTALEVKVIAVRINFAEHRIVDTDAVVITIDPQEPFTGAAIPVDAPGKGTLIVTLQVRGLYHEYPSANAKYLAADIIAVSVPQIPQLIHKPVYPRQPMSLPYQRALSGPADNYPAQPLIQRE
ncbi:hypothetical protein [Chitinophaga sp. S165]|uniref:hypothetical protein n=1 Tax=Chitinophaga sp. S165 TaxID=2135462 RepID=UPI000D711569|nr:hypothetical protein [Chitinophaga sp. S165]